MKTVFLGDSFTSGENNKDTSFCDYVDLGTTYNLGISGTTMGEYSIYPVDGNSLLSVIQRHISTIKIADVIFIEYGINDVSAIMSGFVSEDVVLVSFVKALDAIKQINPKAMIYFLSISNDDNIIKKYAELQCKYLMYDYFADFDFNIPSTLWAAIYIRLMNKIRMRVPVVPMITDINFLDKYISDDKIHPNNEGYKIIANNII